MKRVGIFVEERKFNELGFNAFIKIKRYVF